MDDFAFMGSPPHQEPQADVLLFIDMKQVDFLRFNSKTYICNEINMLWRLLCLFSSKNLARICRVLVASGKQGGFRCLTWSSVKCVWPSIGKKVQITNTGRAPSRERLCVWYSTWIKESLFFHFFSFPLISLFT